MRYYNSYTGDFSDIKPEGLSYGIQHSRTETTSSHSPMDGNFSTRGLSSPFRERPPVFTEQLPQASVYDYAFAVMGAEFLLHSLTYMNTARFLLNIIGAWDSGYCYGEDTLFIFEMRLYPVQIEFYVAPDGSITEIVRYNQQTQDEVVIPVDFYGLGYVMCQVYMNFVEVNFSRIDFNDKVIVDAREAGKLADYNLIKSSPFTEIRNDPEVKKRLIKTWVKKPDPAPYRFSRNNEAEIETEPVYEKEESTWRLYSYKGVADRLSFAVVLFINIVIFLTGYILLKTTGTYWLMLLSVIIQPVLVLPTYIRRTRAVALDPPPELGIVLWLSGIVGMLVLLAMSNKRVK